MNIDINSTQNLINAINNNYEGEIKDLNINISETKLNY